MIAAARRGRKGAFAPTLVFVTDPDRTPAPVAIAETLPQGSVVIFRGFGRPGAEAAARAMASTARGRRLLILVGADPRLAATVGADGVHLPERSLHLAPRLRRAHPRWLLTGAVHSAAALRKAERFGLDAVLMSPVFASRSPSAGRPLGVIRFARLVRDARVPVIALGGISGATARKLLGAGAAGLAAVEGLADPRVRT